MKFFPKLRKVYKGIIPTCDPFQIIDGDLPITVQYYTFVSGSLTLTERVILNALVRKHNPQVIFEIGTFDGRTTANMAANSSEATIVYTFDLPQDQIGATRLSIDDFDRPFIQKPESGTQYRRAGHQDKIEQLFGDTATYDFTPYHGMVDFVFVDGSHSYEYVKNDSLLAMQLRKTEKSLILWHDYDRPGEWPGLSRALDELYMTNRDFAGVERIQGTSFVISR